MLSPDISENAHYLPAGSFYSCHLNADSPLPILIELLNATVDTAWQLGLLLLGLRTCGQVLGSLALKTITRPAPFLSAHSSNAVVPIWNLLVSWVQRDILPPKFSEDGVTVTFLLLSQLLYEDLTLNTHCGCHLAFCNWFLILKCFIFFYLYCNT